METGTATYRDSDCYLYRQGLIPIETRTATYRDRDCYQ
jgi:hypothetical protein